MKKTKVSEAVLNNQRKDASISTQVKNTFEAYRAGVATGKYSSEYAYAKCGCCYEGIPKIDGVWDQTQYEFLKSPYGTSGGINQDHLRVHPSLWNNGTNNVLSGVFEVLPGRIYQVRGYDMANISFVRTTLSSDDNDDNGNDKDKDNDDKLSENDRWMVMDTLMSTQCTKAALELFDEYLKTKNSAYSLKGNIVGMIVSHSHVDHYGGMRAVKDWFVGEENAELINEEGKEQFKDSDYPRIDVPFILAPNGFFEHSVSENVYVGNAMGRRASYQYGSFIKPEYNENDENDPNNYLSGEISIGIGQGQSTGEISFVVPTMEIGENCTLILDNLEVGFQLTPGTEAPAEMNNYFSDYNALWLAENCNGTLHNLYTLRGAQVRDGKAWAGYLMETVALYGKDVQVIFQSHNWPHWDNSLDPKYVPTNGADDKIPRTDLRAFLIDTAAIYKYINDQTLLYMNMGYKMNEASDMLTLPRAMQKNWCLKPFYGTPKHNAKAVYQRYLGWYDANPLHLEELPPEQLAQEQLRYMMAGGSTDNILKMVEDDIQKGNYWTAAYMAHQVVIGSEDATMVGNAKVLCAEALEQLGYQCESGTWRNAYLSAAYELRSGKGRVSASGGSMFEHLTTEMILDYISIIFDGERGSNISFDGYLSVQLTDKNNVVVATENFLFVVRNGAILYSPVSKIPDGAELIEVNKNDLSIIVTGVAENTKINLSGVLLKIFYCVIRFEIDRYKYFDIMGKHDSEVQRITDESEDSGECVDLREYVHGCISLLESYVSKCEGLTGTTAFSGSDKILWDDFYDVLKVQTGVILDGDFFDPANVNAGIGKDGKFYAHELFYNLFSLLRYLNAPYIKNDFNFRCEDTELEAYIKIKEKIKLLETYLPDCYLKDNAYTVQFDADDINAWEYLCGERKENMSIDEFMCNLYMNYAVLSASIGTLTGNIPNINICYLESDSKICLNYCTAFEGEYVLKDGEVTHNLSKQKGEVIVDVPKEKDKIFYVIYQKVSYLEIPMTSVIFNKPQLECSTSVRRTKQEVERLAFENNGGFCELINIGTEADPIIATAYEAPSRPINYTLYYSTQNVDKLIVNGEEQQDVSSGSVTIQSKSYSASFNVVGYSKCGFYVQQNVSCSG